MAGLRASSGRVVERCFIRFLLFLLFLSFELVWLGIEAWNWGHNSREGGVPSLPCRLPVLMR